MAATPKAEITTRWLKAHQALEDFLNGLDVAWTRSTWPEATIDRPSRREFHIFNAECDTQGRMLKVDVNADGSYNLSRGQADYYHRQRFGENPQRGVGLDVIKTALRWLGYSV